MRNPVLRFIGWAIFWLLALAAAAIVAWTLFVVWGPDWISTHDVPSAKGMLLVAARDDARGRLLTLGAGLFAAGALVYTARNFTLSRRTSLNKHYSEITDQIGDDEAAVRVAGLQAMARLADDWKANQQGCIDVLCAYLRMNRGISPGGGVAASSNENQERQARAIVIRLIAEHLRTPGFWRKLDIIGRRFSFRWQGRYFDFTGVVFDVGDFDDVVFKAPYVRFDGAEFKGNFGLQRAKFTRGKARFDNATFSGNDIKFNDAEFSADPASFDYAQFSGTVSFDNTKFKSGGVSFYLANFSGNVHFNDAEFTGGTVGFNGANFVGTVRFEGAHFRQGCQVYFERANFSGGEVHLENADFDGGILDLRNPRDYSTPPSLVQPGQPIPQGVHVPQ